MLPNISRNGRSFRAAGAYHLHDKPTDAQPRPRTAERIAFTATRNLANEDPRAALDEMWRTAEDAAHLKARAGLAPTGRKATAPVKTVSLAWVPGQAPTREEMCAAADSFTKVMGWGEHQVLYVAHNDTRHHHLHLIINRVHPDTGRTLNDWQEKKRAQKWAHGYDLQQGAVHCPARAARQHGCVRPPSTGLPHADAKLLQHLPAVTRGQIARQARTAFRPVWAAHYRHQRAALARFDRHRRGVERIAAHLARQGNALDAMQALDALDQRRAQLFRSLARQRAAIGRARHAALKTLLAEAPAPASRKGQGASWNRTNASRPFLAAASTPAAPHRAAILQHLRLARSFAILGAKPASDRPAQAHQLAALRRAAYAALRPARAPPPHAAARARAEIAVQFAHRWAAIRRMPLEERAAAAAALRAEQDAALAARTKHLIAEQQQERQGEGHRRRAHLALWRASLRHRRQARAATALVKTSRPLLTPRRPPTAAQPVPPPASTPA
jgi:hypothetical protein